MNVTIRPGVNMVPAGTEFGMSETITKYYRSGEYTTQHRPLDCPLDCPQPGGQSTLCSLSAGLSTVDTGQ